MYMKAYQCKCGKLYSINFKAEPNQVCQGCGRDICTLAIAEKMNVDDRLKKVTVYRKYFWNRWEVVEVEKCD